MRIALVTDFYPPEVGGIEVQVHGLARALTLCGHEVCVFTTARGGTAADDVRVERLPFSRVPRTSVAIPSPANYRRLRDRLAAGRFDIVHAHGMFSTLGMGGLLAAHELGIPGITTHHSLIRLSLIPFARLAYACASNRAVVITAVSEAAAKDARRASGRQSVMVVPNGIELATPGRPQPTRSTADPVNVVGVMRLKFKKRPYHLVWYMGRVAKRLSDRARVRFTIVGDGPERQRLRRLATWLGVDGAITFAGACTREEVAAILNDADLFVSTSRVEAFGLALLEARVAGLPIVAIRGGGVADIVKHGRDGLLTGSGREFVDATVNLIENAVYRRQLAAAGRSGVERFSWDLVAARYLDGYRLAIDESRRRWQCAAG